MSEYKDMVNDVVAHLSRANVEVIFGESRELKDKVIIPVGKVRYGWGAGGGKGPQGKETGAQPEGEGSGIGMGVMVKPMGFITVTADSVKYQPIVDFGPLMWVLGPALALAILKLSKAMIPKPMHKYPGHKWGMGGGWGRCPWMRQMTKPHSMGHYMKSHAKPYFMKRIK